VKVKVVRVNLEQAKIDFVLVEDVIPAEAGIQAKRSHGSGWVPASAGTTGSKKPRDQDKRMTKIDSRHTDGKRKKKK
jgi:hypothetical protein